MLFAPDRSGAIPNPSQEPRILAMSATDQITSPTTPSATGTLAA